MIAKQIRLKDETVKHAKILAEAEHRSLTNFLEAIVTDYVKNETFKTKVEYETRD